jgi:NAD(P)-dependent dehydrogenase (short-subunit alcohol dehydrogenase family)
LPEEGSLTDELRDKAVVVTGAGGGVGRALCRQIAQQGGRVVAVGRTEAKLEATLDAVRSLGGEGRAVAGDIADPETARRAVEVTCEAYGGVDVLINNAAVGYSYEATRPNSMATLAAQPPELWREVIDINLNGAAIMTQRAIPALLRRPGANIVFISSIMGLGGSASAHAYAAAKAGMMNLVQSLAVTHGPAGLRVNCVAPGLIETEMVANVFDSSVLQSDTVRFGICPLGRAAQPDEIASAALFLASTAASYITGAILPVDGGRAARL